GSKWRCQPTTAKLTTSPLRQKRCPTALHSLDESRDVLRHLDAERYDPRLRPSIMPISWAPREHRQRHEAVYFGCGLSLAGFAVACVVHGNDRMAHAHRKHRMTAVHELTFQNNLLEIS